MSSIVEGSHFLRLTFSGVDVSLGDVDIFCIAGLEVSIGLELELGLGLVVSAFLTVILLVTSLVGAFLTIILLIMSFVGAFLQLFASRWLVICLS